jgi:P27 family predicted phage terminase small subunit
MAKTGPAPQPTVKRILKGNPGRRPLPQNEPRHRRSKKIPLPPSYLDSVGSKEWKRISKELYPLGLLTIVDYAALGGYCASYSAWVDAQEKIKKEGSIIVSPSGFPMQSPYLQIANKSMAEMRKWLIEFGMTPSSRTRVSVGKPDDNKDPLAEFMTKGGGKPYKVK